MKTNYDDYYPELEDLLADLDVLTELDRRIEKYPELRVKIENVVQPDRLEATIKAVAVVVREHLRRNGGEDGKE